MVETRRPYRREPEDVRREALIGAALELIAEGGPGAATVRAIADRAGVTPGLIRHYFTSKDELVLESYRQTMERMTADNAAVLAREPADPLGNLADFVVAALTPPVADPARAGLWAGFLYGVQNDPRFKEIHIQNYLAYRDILNSLIEQLPRAVSAERCRDDAIACNGVIDGLWLEASSVPEIFVPGQIAKIGLTAVGAILGVDLLGGWKGDQAAGV